MENLSNNPYLDRPIVRRSSKLAPVAIVKENKPELRKMKRIASEQLIVVELKTTGQNNFYNTAKERRAAEGW